MPTVGAPVTRLLLGNKPGDMRREPITGPRPRRPVVIPPRLREEPHRRGFVDRAIAGQVVPQGRHQRESSRQVWGAATGFENRSAPAIFSYVSGRWKVAVRHSRTVSSRTPSAVNA